MKELGLIELNLDKKEKKNCVAQKTPNFFSTRLIRSATAHMSKFAPREPV